MRKLSLTLKVTLATALMLLGGVVAASPAQAATCSIDKICLWTSTNFTGSKLEFTLSGGCTNLAYPYDNNISSFFSNSQKDFRGYLSYNGTGSYLLMEQGWDSSISAPYNNAISSVCWWP